MIILYSKCRNSAKHQLLVDMRMKRVLISNILSITDKSKTRKNSAYNKFEVNEKQFSFVHVSISKFYMKNKIHYFLIVVTVFLWTCSYLHELACFWIVHLIPWHLNKSDSITKMFFSESNLQRIVCVGYAWSFFLLQNDLHYKYCPIIALDGLWTLNFGRFDTEKSSPKWLKYEEANELRIFWKIFIRYFQIAGEKKTIFHFQVQRRLTLFDIQFYKNSSEKLLKQISSISSTIKWNSPFPFL